MSIQSIKFINIIMNIVHMSNNDDEKDDEKWKVDSKLKKVILCDENDDEKKDDGGTLFITKDKITRMMKMLIRIR